jgi:hypothetical protein
MFRFQYTRSAAALVGALGLLVSGAALAAPAAVVRDAKQAQADISTGQMGKAVTEAANAMTAELNTTQLTQPGIATRPLNATTCDLAAASDDIASGARVAATNALEAAIHS